MNSTNSILNLPYDIDEWTLSMLKRGNMVFHIYKGDGIYLVRKDHYWGSKSSEDIEDIEDEFVIDGVKIIVLNSI